MAAKAASGGGGAGGAAASGASAPVNADAIRAAIKVDTVPCALPLGPDKGGEHSYAYLNAETFNVRGAGYLSDGKKVAAGPAVFDLMMVEIFTSNDKIGNVARRSGSYLRRARAAGDTRYYLVIVYVTTSAPYVHVILYYAVNAERVAALPHLAAVWSRFTAPGAEGDAFRNERWKVIPRIAEGSWIVSTAVGTKPALLAQKLTHTWIFGEETAGAAAEGAGAPAAAAGGAGDAGSAGSAASAGGAGLGPYLEGDCDVASSTVAQMLVGLLQQYAKHLVIDLGFAIEPRDASECPEVVLGAVRLNRIDVGRPPLVKARAGDWVLGSAGVVYADPEGEVGARELPSEEPDDEANE